MHKAGITFLGAILFFFAMTSYGFDISSLDNPETRKAAITNLLIGLNSDNYGLRTSSAFMLGEIKADEAVIPLMKMLRTEKHECGRIAAALALYKINDSRGVFAVKQAIRFDNNQWVRKMCSNFYNQTLRDRFGISEDATDSSNVVLK
jgi:hypothetical protein